MTRYYIKIYYIFNNLLFNQFLNNLKGDVKKKWLFVFSYGKLVNIVHIGSNNFDLYYGSFNKAWYS